MAINRTQAKMATTTPESQTSISGNGKAQMARFAPGNDFPLMYPAGSGTSQRLRQALCDPDATLVSQTITIQYTYDPFYRLTVTDLRRWYLFPLQTPRATAAG